MLTPIGVLGGIRGVFFANMGGALLRRPRLQVLYETTAEVVHADHRLPEPDHRQSRGASLRAADRRSTGSACVDARASYGIGLETFALGFPIHFDWSWRTLFNKDWEDVLFYAYGGSDEFRKPKFSVWIGYDF